MGYDSCPMIGFEIEKVAELINLPSDHVIGPLIAIGKGTKDALAQAGPARPRRGRDPRPLLSPPSQRDWQPAR
jgi:nitroreductase